jgi:hypothetical protein
MGIQINGQTDTISAVDGALTVSGAELPTVTNLNATGIVTATGFVGNITGNINATGVSTIATLNVTQSNPTNLNVSGVTTTATLRATSIVGVTTAGITTAYVTSINEGQLQGYRNMLYNGAMVVNQRGFTSAASTSTGYSVDRWVYDSSSDAVVAIGQSTSVAAQPTGQGFTNSLHVRVTTADSSLSTGQYASIQQRLEGYDLQRIKKGSANAEPVTLSFWVRSSKTGTYICELFDDDNSRQVSKSYTINAADTWEKKIITFPADTTGSFNNDRDLSLYVFWWLAAGSTYSSGTLNTSWAGFTQANRAAGQVNFLDTAGAQFNLTGCQLEVGPNATDFEFRSYGDELRMCQRYYEKSYEQSVTPGTATGSGYSLSLNNADQASNKYICAVDKFAVVKRAAPTMRFWDIAGNLSRVSHYTLGGLVRTDNNNTVYSYTGFQQNAVMINNQAASTCGAYQWEASIEL